MDINNGRHTRRDLYPIQERDAGAWKPPASHYPRPPHYDTRNDGVFSSNHRPVPPTLAEFRRMEAERMRYESATQENRSKRSVMDMDSGASTPVDDMVNQLLDKLYVSPHEEKRAASDTAMRGMRTDEGARAALHQQKRMDAMLEQQKRTAAAFRVANQRRIEEDREKIHDAQVRQAAAARAFLNARHGTADVNFFNREAAIESARGHDDIDTANGIHAATLRREAAAKSFLLARERRRMDMEAGNAEWR